jgi:transcriptional antiterminator
MNHINSNEEFIIIKQKVTSIINKYNLKLTDFLSPDTINHLATHITIAMVRIQSKNYIPLSISQIESIQDNKVLKYAKAICQDIQEEFNMLFPEGEIAVISMYLSKNRLLDVEIKSGFDLLDKEIFDILKHAMSKIYESYDYDFRNNDTLWISIGLHLTSAIERLHNHQMLVNPLTNNIKTKNPLAFSLASIINNTIEEQCNASLSEDEIAFLAIHFLNAIEESSK